MRKRENNQCRNIEQGYVMIIFALVCIPLFIFIAFAIDLARVAYTQWSLQRASDAAVLSALSYRSKVGWTAANQNPNLVQDIIRNSIGGNLRQDKGLNLNAGGLNAETACNPDNTPPGEICLSNLGYDSLEDRAQVGTFTSVPLRFAQVIPTAQQELLIGATAGFLSEAQLAPVAVILLLDVSGSMNEPVNPNDTSCIPDPTIPTCRKKIDNLREAVRAFTRMLNPNRDRLAIVKYATRAETIWSLNWPINNATQINTTARNFPCGSWILRGNPYCTLNNVLAGLNSSPAANTNIADAFLEGTRELNFTLPNLRTAGIENVAYVLFTDGAPTAGTFSFQNIKDNSVLTTNQQQVYNLLAFNTSLSYLDHSDNKYKSINLPSTPVIFDWRATILKYNGNAISPHNLYYSWKFGRTNPYGLAAFYQKPWRAEYKYPDASPDIGFGYYKEFDDIKEKQGYVSFCNANCEFVSNPYERVSSSELIEQACFPVRRSADDPLYKDMITSADSPNYDGNRGTSPDCNMRRGSMPNNSGQVFIESIADASNIPSMTQTVLNNGYSGVLDSFKMCAPSCLRQGQAVSFGNNQVFEGTYNLNSSRVLSVDTSDDVFDITANPDAFQRIYYWNAILWADYVRSLSVDQVVRSARVYSIGLGMPAANLASQQNLYGDSPANDSERKDAFLYRLSNDRTAPFFGNILTSENTFTYHSNDQNFTQDMNQFCRYGETDYEFDRFNICGEYRPVSNPNEIIGAFASIGRAIALKLIN